MTNKPLPIWIAALLAFAPNLACAQMITIAPPISPAQCSAAVASLNAGERNGDWDIVDQCGPNGIAAVASAIRGMRTDADSVYLKRLIRVAKTIRSNDVLMASQEVSIDNAATVSARVSALLILLSQYDPTLHLPMRLSWTEFATVPTGKACRLTRFSDVAYSQSTEMPTDYLNTIAGTAEQIASAPQTPPVVKDFASCVRQSLANVLPPTLLPSSITVSYVCANKFNVTNSSSIPGLGTYQVEATTERGDIAVPSNGSVEIITIKTGAIAISFLGFITPSVANVGTPCT